MGKNSYIAKLLLQKNQWGYWIKAQISKDDPHQTRVGGFIVTLPNRSTAYFIGMGYLPCDGTPLSKLPDTYAHIKGLLRKAHFNNLPDFNFVTDIYNRDQVRAASAKADEISNKISDIMK